jgi:CheY-like chemotaxis protein
VAKWRECRSPRSSAWEPTVRRTRDPMLSEPQALSAARASSTVENPFAEVTIMMIDDEKLNSFVVAVYLKADGYRDLVHTTDPVNAMSMAARVRPEVILLDIDMPRLNGIELLRRIRADETLAETLVVILSATDDEEIKSQAVELKVAGFLKKPIRKDELLTDLRQILARGLKSG